MSPKTLKGIAAGHLSTGEVCKALGLTQYQLNYRIAQGILPPHDQGGKSASWLFSQAWLAEAKRVLGL